MLRPNLAWAASIVVLLTLALSSVRANAEPALPPSWPDPLNVADIRGQSVTFDSHSPFTLTDVGAGSDRDPPTTAQGTLFMPAGASAAAPVPAVVMLHGAGGTLSSREHTYGRQLASMGVAALAVDVFGARRDMAGGFIERLLNVTESMFLADAYSALDFLSERDDIDMSRVALLGFSYGGMVATFAAYKQIADLFAPDGHRFAAHAAFYAPCIADFEDSTATGAPVLMIYGARDAIVDPGRCGTVAGALSRGGAKVSTIIYQDAVHQWDGRINGPRKVGRNLAPCRFRVNKDGVVRDARLRVAMSSPLTRRAMLGLCSDSEGYLLGRDDDVRARSNRDLASFLNDVFVVTSEPRNGRTAADRKAN